jgi:DNA-binding MarR family transcriptional regulator
MDEDAELGQELGLLFRAHLRLALSATGDLPGGPRGYQVLVESERGGRGNQLELARHLGVDRTVMTYLLDDLERAGLVARRPDPADRRARQVLLTDAGRERLRATRCRLHTAEEHLLAALDPAERDHLRDLLHRLAAGLDGSPGSCQVVGEIAELDPASAPPG